MKNQHSGWIVTFSPVLTEISGFLENFPRTADMVVDNVSRTGYNARKERIVLT